MPFIPHTSEEVEQMCSSIGVANIAALFDEIPENLRAVDFKIPHAGLTEFELTQAINARFKESAKECYAGGGAYDHHIPAAVWDIASRGEFLTAYTPYQSEASQGTLQLLWEFQSMICALTAMEVTNTSLYDGASALAEAVLMAMRIKRASKPSVVIGQNINPSYMTVLKTFLKPHDVNLIEIPYDMNNGTLKVEDLKGVLAKQDIMAVVLNQPNYFGQLEEVDALSQVAQDANALLIAVVNPTSLALLKPPGQWGVKGVDIVVGEGQPLGIPLMRGGPYLGFICCRQEYIRQLPGRIVGKTVDDQNRTGFTLTLQAREQHIRRAKATSNICTNQGLLVTAATIYMSLMGQKGLYNVALTSNQNTQFLLESLVQIDGVKQLFDGTYFHEVAVQLPCPVNDVIERMGDKGYLAGVDLASHFKELDNTLLVCATETKTKDSIKAYCQALSTCIQGVMHGHF